MAKSLNANLLTFYATLNLVVPEEGPKACPVGLDFSNATEIDLDLSNFIERKYISLVQALFLDNSTGGTPLVVTCPNIVQSIQIAPNRQGYFMFLCPNPAKLVFTSQAGVLLKAQLLNFPVVNHDWPTITGA